MKEIHEVPGARENVDAVLGGLSEMIEAGIVHWGKTFEGPCVVVVIDTQSKPAVKLASRSFPEALTVDRGDERYVVTFLALDDLQRRLEHLGTSVPVQCGMTIEQGRVPCFLAIDQGLVFATFGPRAHPTTTTADAATT